MLANTNDSVLYNVIYLFLLLFGLVFGAMEGETKSLLSCLLTAEFCRTWKIAGSYTIFSRSVQSVIQDK